MAVNILKGSAITNRDASPKEISDARLSKGAMQEACGVLQSVSGDSIGSTYIFGSVRSNARISQILLGS